jgi:hypothetical protein
MLLGHRYGHSLYSRHKIRNHLRASYLKVTLEDPITWVLSAAFNREDEYFYDDIVLTDEAGGFIGFIFMKTLVTLQNRFFLENIDKLERKQTELNQKNQQMERYAEQPPTRLFDAILTELKDFSGNGEFSDDMCMIGVEVATLCLPSENSAIVQAQESG